MKKRIGFLVLVSVAAMPLLAMAADPAPVAAEKEKKQSAPPGMFERLDENHDGKVTKDEFVRREYERFKRMDKDGSGILSKEEVDPPPRVLTPEEQKKRAEMEAEREKRRAERMKEMEAEYAKQKNAPDKPKKPTVKSPAKPSDPKTEEKKKGWPW